MEIPWDSHHSVSITLTCPLCKLRTCRISLSIYQQVCPPHLEGKVQCRRPCHWSWPKNPDKSMTTNSTILTILYDINDSSTVVFPSNFQRRFLQKNVSSIMPSRRSQHLLLHPKSCRLRTWRYNAINIMWQWYWELPPFTNVTSKKSNKWLIYFPCILLTSTISLRPLRWCASAILLLSRWAASHCPWHPTWYGSCFW